MASVIKGGHIKNVLARTYSAQSAAASAVGSQASVGPKTYMYGNSSAEVEVSTTKHGVLVASVENAAPTSHVAIMFKSGSSFETPKNLGVSHVLRLCAGLGTQNFSQIGVTRNFQQMGGNLTCESGREHVSYGMSILRDFLPEALPILADVAVNPAFKHWEVQNDNMTDRIKTEMVNRDPSTIVLEMLHNAAFRNSGLGNSLYIPQYKIGIPEYKSGGITSEQLKEFVGNTHSLKRMVVVGTGVDHTDLYQLCQKIRVKDGEGISNPSSYQAGEIRQETGASLAFVAVAGAGAKLGTPEAASLAVLQAILGTQHGLKNMPFSNYSLGKLSSAAKQAGGTGVVSPINVNYSDHGLFGFLVAEEAAKAGDVVRALANTMKTLKVTDQDVKQGIAKAKSSLLMDVESPALLAEDIGMQILTHKECTTPSKAAAALDSVTVSSVQNALSAMLKSKPSMAAYGGIVNVPYLDQL